MSLNYATAFLSKVVLKLALKITFIENKTKDLSRISSTFIIFFYKNYD